MASAKGIYVEPEPTHPADRTSEVELIRPAKKGNTEAYRRLRQSYDSWLREESTDQAEDIDPRVLSALVDHGDDETHQLLRARYHSRILNELRENETTASNASTSAGNTVPQFVLTALARIGDPDAYQLLRSRSNDWLHEELTEQGEEHVDPEVLVVLVDRGDDEVYQLVRQRYRARMLKELKARETQNRKQGHTAERVMNDGTAPSRTRELPEFVLIALAHTRDSEAVQLLSERYKETIKRISARVSCADMPLDEKYHAGLDGFRIAAEKYNPSHNARARLSTYAYLWIRGAVIKACSDLHGLSDEARKQYSRIKELRAEFDRMHGKYPTAEQILEMSTQDGGQVLDLTAIEQVLNAFPESLDETVERPPKDAPFDVRVIRMQGMFDEVTAPETLGWVEGTRYIALTVANENIGYAWADVALLLLKPDDPDAGGYWLEASAGLSLPIEMPETWADVCALFDPNVRPKRPKLTAYNLEKWMQRRAEKLYRIRHPEDPTLKNFQR